MTDKEIHEKLVEFGTKILYKRSLPEGLPFISSYAKAITGADRCSMFIYDSVNKELWTTLADGVEKLIIPADKGIIGETLKHKKGIIENDVNSNPYFLSEVDMHTGYDTKNIITAPVFNVKKEVVGILQLLNKNSDFNEGDLKYMDFFANSLSDFVELVNLYKD